MLGFRVWNGDKMIYPLERVELAGPMCSMFGNLLMWDISALTMLNKSYNLIKPPEEYIPMQSTGQLDMDGKMIYEGDVISTDQGIFVYASCVRNFYISCLVHKLSGFKLIGNIYENEGLGVLKDAGI